MITIQIIDRGSIRPGGRVRARVDWSFERAPREVAVRLLFVSRAGEHDEVRAHGEEIFDHVERAGSRECVFDAPASPWSYEGALVTLRWVIEAVAQPGGAAREEIVLAPEGRPRRGHPV